jgi:hypothetical protein
MVLRLARATRARRHALVFAAGCALATLTAATGAPEIDATARARFLALDCTRPADVAATAARVGVPAPRIINLQGSVPIVNMESFAEFLTGMGYPEASLRDPHDGSLSYSSYASSEELAGMLAWYYERDGMRPMLIGHSQGGMLVVRTLHELAGGFHDALNVYDPATRSVQPRTTIRDPYSHTETPVVGMKVAFAAALATGTLPRILLGQWSMLPKLRKIPDTVEEFTGFAIAWDPIAGNFATAEPYVALGSAVVRNVLLPASYSHIGLPITAHLASHPATRAWIEDYRPDIAQAPIPADPAIDVRNLLHAADLWFSVRRHWCAEGQRWLLGQS